MIIPTATPLYARSEFGEYVSRVVGYEVDDATGEITEILTEYGSVPASCILFASPWRTFLDRVRAALHRAEAVLRRDPAVTA